jgi:hypothetical protein
MFGRDSQTIRENIFTVEDEQTPDRLVVKIETGDANSL